jgi:hypothetical protein
MDSVNLTNPQTLNLYAYCINDPVNLVDPSGLGFLSFLKKIFVRGLKAVIAAAVAFVVTFVQTGSFDRAKAAAKQAFIANFRQIPRRRIGTPPTFPVGIGRPPLHEIFRGTLLSRLFPAPAELLKWTHISHFQAVRNDCLQLAAFVEKAAREAWTDRGFARRIWGQYAEHAFEGSELMTRYNDSGFHADFLGSETPNQPRHFAGIFYNAFVNAQRALAATVIVSGPATAVTYAPSLAAATRGALYFANRRETTGDEADKRLNARVVPIAVRLAYGYASRFDVAPYIRRYICARTG